MDRQLRLYISLLRHQRSTGHLFRDCDDIVKVSDNYVRIWTGRTSILPRDIRICSRCFPSSLDHLEDLAPVTSTTEPALAPDAPVGTRG